MTVKDKQIEAVIKALDKKLVLSLTADTPLERVSKRLYLCSCRDCLKKTERAISAVVEAIDPEAKIASSGLDER